MRGRELFLSAVRLILWLEGDKVNPTWLPSLRIFLVFTELKGPEGKSERIKAFPAPRCEGTI